MEAFSSSGTLSIGKISGSVNRNFNQKPPLPCPEMRSFKSAHYQSSERLKGSQLLNSIQKRNPVGQAFSSEGVYTYVGSDVESPTHDVEEKVGVLLLNLGGPETLHDVQPFLFNLFADPDIIRLPRLFRFLQGPLAQLISVLRAPKSKEGYASIGGGSPLRKITNEQAQAIKAALEARSMHVNVYVGMRYWYPFTEEAIEQVSP